MASHIDALTAARTAALFTSDLSARCPHSYAEVTAAIMRALRIHHGGRGCAGEVAAAYGDHPETVASRMRWARAVVEGFDFPRADACSPPDLPDYSGSAP